MQQPKMPEHQLQNMETTHRPHIPTETPIHLRIMRRKTMNWMLEQKILVVARQLGEATTREIFDKLDSNTQRLIESNHKISRILKKNGYKSKKTNTGLNYVILWFKPRITGNKATKDYNPSYKKI